MDQIRMKLDIDACNRNDCLNAMRQDIDKKVYKILFEERRKL